MKTALVTGANKGLGFETARQLAQNGFKVFLGSRNEERGLAAEKVLLDEKLDVKFVKLDVNSNSDIRAAMDLIKSSCNKLDVLVNNAGVFLESLHDDPKESSILKIDPVIILKTIETNTMGPLKLIQNIIPMMLESGEGRIINISSGMGALNEMDAYWPGYRMSKTALNALTVMTAKELSGTKISINSICPGWCKTDMGGENANRSIEEGVETTVWLATCDNPPSGQFLIDKEQRAW
jgi:NAD(P)-dependent dehydrogenase (short-subunit alcohol dehydrogenase family)